MKFGEVGPRDYRRRNNPGRPNGYASRPGTGPAGETCGSCRHIHKSLMSKAYYKCDLMSHIWTAGIASDVAVRSPACSRWDQNADIPAKVDALLKNPPF